MLVLTRKLQESLILTLPCGRTVRVTFCRKRGDDVRIGIEAPDDVPVFRSELVTKDSPLERRR